MKPYKSHLNHVKATHAHCQLKLVLSSLPAWNLWPCQWGIQPRTSWRAWILCTLKFPTHLGLAGGREEIQPFKLCHITWSLVKKKKKKLPTKLSMCRWQVRQSSWQYFTFGTGLTDPETNKEKTVPERLSPSYKPSLIKLIPLFLLSSNSLCTNSSPLAVCSHKPHAAEQEPSCGQDGTLFVLGCPDPSMVHVT